MRATAFFGLLHEDDKARALTRSVEDVRGRRVGKEVFIADTTSFGKVPGSPFAYWVSDRVRDLFTEYPQFETKGRTARQGLATADDFQFVRAWWEVEAATLLSGTRSTDTSAFRRSTFGGSVWAPLAKGGAYSPFYADIHLVVKWRNAGEAIRNFTRAYIRNEDLYFRPGLTWSLRSQRGFSVRCLPAGCTFGHKGPAIFVRSDAGDHLFALLSILNSQPFHQLLQLQTAFGSYEVGVIQRTPIPTIAGEQIEVLAAMGEQAYAQSRERGLGDEITHSFVVPSMVAARASGRKVAARQVRARQTQWETRLRSIEGGIGRQVGELYGFTPADLSHSSQYDGALLTPDQAEVEEAADDGPEQPGGSVENLLMWCVGCALGRWDVRLALDPTLAPTLQGPFDPLPVCSPGMLVGPDGLCARSGRIVSKEWLWARPDVISLLAEDAVAEPTIPDADYPLRIDWGGILVDDPDHRDDIVFRVREVLHLLWDDLADAIEAEAVGILGVKELRDYFRNPRHFWDFHVKRYSKSRRKAPIYWLLQSPKRHYALWLYYHRLDPDILFKALLNYVEPKIRLEEDRLAGLEARRATTPAGAETRRLEKAIDQQEAVLSDLHEFRDRLDRAARLHLQPDLDDGVLLNIAPLWELVPWKEAKRAWDELRAGKYEWSSIGKQLRERGLV